MIFNLEKTTIQDVLTNIYIKHATKPENLNKPQEEVLEEAFEEMLNSQYEVPVSKIKLEKITQTQYKVISPETSEIVIFASESEANEFALKRSTEEHKMFKVEEFATIIKKPVEINTELRTLAGVVSPQNTANVREKTFSIIDYSKVPVIPSFTHKSDNNKFINAFVKLAPNLDAYSLGASLTSIRKGIENMCANMGIEGAKKQQCAPYFYSKLGGTGKSTLLKHIEGYCKRNHIPTTNAAIRGRWVGSEHSKAIGTFIEEYMPPRANSDSHDLTIIKQNNIIDNTEYEIEYKGQMSFYVTSRTTIFMCSNYLPFDNNDRRYGLVKFNEAPYSKISEEDKIKYFPERTEEEWDELVKELFESCPFGKTWTDPTRRNSESLDRIIYLAREAKELTSGFYDLTNCSIKSFSDFYCLNHSINDMKQKSTFKWQLTQDVIKAAAEGLIKPSHKVNGSYEYSKYNWNDIADMELNEDNSFAVLDEIDNSYEAVLFAKKAFEEAVENEVENVEVIKETLGFDSKKTQYYCKDTFDSFNTNKNCEYILTALPTEEYVSSVVEAKKEGKEVKLSRKAANVYPTHFVYEMDETSLEEQQEIINEMDKTNVHTITFSGNKSFHILVPISYNKEDLDFVKENFKFYHEQVGRKLLGEKYDLVDKKCASVGRLSRNPGATRADNGKVQECVYRNNFVKPVFINTKALKKTIEENEKTVQTLNATKKTFENRSFDNSDRELTLDRIYNKTESESVRFGIDILRGEIPSSGSNMIGAIGALKKLESSIPELAGISDEVRAICHEAHPTNIGK